MKTVIASLLFVATTVVAVAQGQLFFANLAPGVNAPISDSSGNLIIGPNPYVADLFWSINTNASMDSLTPAGYNTSFFVTNSYGGGYFFGVNAKLPNAYLLAQVRVWDTNYGSTYYEARDNGGEFGFSNLIVVLPVPPPGPPSSLVGLKSFILQRLPHLSIRVTTNNTMLLSWSVWDVWGTSYLAQQNEDLNSINWITLTNTPVLVGFEHQVTIPKPEKSMFYRLISQ